MRWEGSLRSWRGSLVSWLNPRRTWGLGRLPQPELGASGWETAPVWMDHDRDLFAGIAARATNEGLSTGRPARPRLRPRDVSASPASIAWDSEMSDSANANAPAAAEPHLAHNSVDT